MTAIESHISNRLRQAIPKGLFIVPGSTRVLSFGSLEGAHVVTLGLNPSRVEFLHKDGQQELIGSDRRLATHRSLALADLVLADLTEASDAVLQQVIDDCNCYFQNKPYKKWFDQLESQLNAVNASYYDGSACHLDLIQWATNPTWRQLDQQSRTWLLSADIPFLQEQLKSDKITLLLANGMSVIDQLQRNRICDFTQEIYISDNCRCTSKLFTGTIGSRIRAVGWSINLQSSHGVTDKFRVILAQHLGNIYGKG